MHSFTLFEVGLLAAVLGLAVLAAYFAWQWAHVRQVLRTATLAFGGCADGDMEQRVVLKTHGETEHFMHTANRLLDVVDAYIRESAASADHAARGLFYREILRDGFAGTWRSSAEVLNRSSAQVRRNLVNSVQQAGSRLEASVMQTVLQLSGSTRQMMDTSTTLNTMASNGSTEAASLETAATQTATNVGAIAAAVEEMTAAVKEISKQVQQSNQLSQAVVQEGEAASKVLNTLVGSSERVSEIAELIKTIASQVNLLSLNATIEAARAGEAGKGFAVVASEVKQLATRTSEATAQVEDYIAAMRHEVQQTHSAIASILQKGQEVNEALCIIASVVEQQSAATLEISGRLQETSRSAQSYSDVVGSIAVASGQTRTVAEQMHQASSVLSQATESLQGNITQFVKELQEAA